MKLNKRELMTVSTFPEKKNRNRKGGEKHVHFDSLRISEVTRLRDLLKVTVPGQRVGGCAEGSFATGRVVPLIGFVEVVLDRYPIGFELSVRCYREVLLNKLIISFDRNRFTRMMFWARLGRSGIPLSGVCSMRVF